MIGPNHFLPVLTLLIFPIFLFAQHVESSVQHRHDEKASSFLIAILMEHTLVPEKHVNQNFFIPSWGFDIEYWMNKQWGIGLHTDLEIETFVILSDSGGDELERHYPVVLTPDALYRP